MRRLLWIILLGLGASLARAETLYVSDRLEVPLRTGTSLSHKIVRMLKSGTALEVLEQDPDSGYTHVRTPGGSEGWILSRYLMPQPAARTRLVAAQQKLAQLQARFQDQARQLQQLQQEKAALEDKLAAASKKGGSLAEQLAEIKRTAASSLALDNENRQLKKRLITMEREQQSLKQENETLRNRTRRDWFMVGAGVIIVGILIGLILPRIRVRRRSSWDSL